MSGIHILCAIAMGFGLLSLNSIVTHAETALLTAAENHLSAVPAPDEIKTDRRSSQAIYSYKVEGAIIRPYRQATVTAEVQGVISKRSHKEGDLIPEGTIVFNISDELFVLIRDRARQKLGAFQAAHQQAEEELKLKENLISKDAATLQEIIKSKAEAKVAGHRAKEAEIELELAQRDLRKCKIPAPFTGYILNFHKDAYESVQRFDPLFLIADLSKAYAVVNVAQSLLSQTVLGTKALFTATSGASFEGSVEKIEASIDPSSQTKKVYVVIDNSGGRLEMGMLGQVTFSPMHR